MIVNNSFVIFESIFRTSSTYLHKFKFKEKYQESQEIKYLYSDQR